jgi:hypothetical protein
MSFSNFTWIQHFIQQATAYSMSLSRWQFMFCEKSNWREKANGSLLFRVTADLKLK